MRDLQADSGFTVRGAVDLPTWLELITTVRRGDRGDAVKAVQVARLWAPPETEPLVKQGSPDRDVVAAVQHLLTAYGHPLSVDGAYGPRTGEAVRQFQLGLRARYLSTTVGQLDWLELIRTVRRGDSGPAVSAVQVMLGVSVDGTFGPRTEDAVRLFQRMWGGDPTEVDGIVGARTWHLLFAPKSE